MKKLQNPHLAQVAAELLVVADEVNNFKKLSKTQFNFKPSPKSWSIAECLQHLLLIYQTRYEPQLKKKFVGTPLPANEKKIPYQATLWGNFIIGIVNPEKKTKIPTLKKFKPASSDFELDLIDTYLNYLTDLQGFIAKSDGLHLNKITIASSISDFLTVNLGDYFRIEAFHHQLHLRQAKRVMESQDFPS
jgi:hypothetical protein